MKIYILHDSVRYYSVRFSKWYRSFDIRFLPASVDHCRHYGRDREKWTWTLFISVHSRSWVNFGSHFFRFQVHEREWTWLIFLVNVNWNSSSFKFTQMRGIKGIILSFDTNNQLPFHFFSNLLKKGSNSVFLIIFFVKKIAPILFMHFFIHKS